MGQIRRTEIAVGFALILAATLLSGCATRRQNQISIAPSHSIPSIWPVMCEQTHVTNRFGDAVASPNGGAHPHRGVDIAVPKGTPVIATADGWVVYADYNQNGYGRLVRVAHGAGIETWYAHLNSLDVKTGARVKQGQQIGRVGKSGRATGFHVHYEVRVNGNPVDPGRYLTALRWCEGAVSRTCLVRSGVSHHGPLGSPGRYESVRSTPLRVEILREIPG